MTETLVTLALAFVLGIGAARVLFLTLPGACRLRIAILALVPPSLLIVVFLAFFDGRPVGEDWFWLGVGFAYFWPWYLAWGVGGLVDALLHRRQQRAL